MRSLAVVWRCLPGYVSRVALGHGTRRCRLPSTRVRANRNHGICESILENVPGWGAGNTLVVLRGPDRTTEASQLCEHARTSGAAVREIAIRPGMATMAHAIDRHSGPGVSIVVLSDARLDLPPGTLQLAGTADVSPFDLWQDPAQITAGTLAAT